MLLLSLFYHFYGEFQEKIIKIHKFVTKIFPLYYIFRAFCARLYILSHFILIIVNFLTPDRVLKAK